MEGAVAVAEADTRRLLLRSSASPAQCGVAAPTHVVAAIPLKPTSRIFLVDPPFLTLNRERLRRQDPKSIQRGIMPLAAKFRTAQPLSGKLSSAVGHVLTTEDAKRKHLLGRELRPKFATIASPHRHRRLNVLPSATFPQLRTCSDPGSKCSIATNRSNPASAGSHVSLQFSTTSPNRTRFQPLRSKSGSSNQRGFGRRAGRAGRVAVIGASCEPSPTWSRRMPCTFRTRHRSAGNCNFPRQPCLCMQATPSDRREDAELG